MVVCFMMIKMFFLSCRNTKCAKPRARARTHTHTHTTHTHTQQKPEAKNPHQEQHPEKNPEYAENTTPQTPHPPNQTQHT